MTTLKRLLLLPLQIIVVILILLDELVRPLYVPMIERFAALRIVERAEVLIASLPRFVILAMLAVPIAVAEPLKIYGLLLIAEGKVVRGAVILVLAYLASFLLIERIYDAGKEKLLTIGWLAWLIGFIAWMRRLMLDWVKRTPIWTAALAAKALASRLLASVRAQW